MRLTDLRGILQYVPRFREKTSHSVRGRSHRRHSWKFCSTCVSLSFSVARPPVLRGFGSDPGALRSAGVPLESGRMGITDAKTLALCSPRPIADAQILEGLSGRPRSSAPRIVEHPWAPARRDHSYGRVEGRRECFKSLVPGSPVVPPLACEAKATHIDQPNSVGDGGARCSAISRLH